ncbi:extracellular catalytic domain type 2 short-chain-length polyhydroxyalkanoate depolymerase [Dyella flagellata]|uniref:Depolymerase n=1 Tax=Dyella flagellata TaxID=1867833 RepID=A0ABQ5XBD9_9GAMM|nr:PHB depolymerase family esterase [Dyella flagellata]GLQ88732.1 depolymerase [Dyella flagellata]
MRWMSMLCVGLWLIVGISHADDAAQPLPHLNLDPSRVAVAGLSSGAYMATQMQMAYPELFPKAALVAGGPYGCAEGKLQTALGTCMKGQPAPDVASLLKSARQREASGEIGPLKGLAHGRVYLLHGTQDAVVAPVVAEAGAQFYTALHDGPGMSGLQVDDDGQRAFAHNLPLAATGDDCGKSVSPYLGHCGFDAAGAVFTHLFGPAPRTAAADASGKLQRFDQDALKPGGVDALLASTGYLYVPPDCRAGKRCGLLVAFHGCKQNVDAVGQAFVKDAGFNRWADVYGVVILYPQTRASFAPLNPQACWDWWGYSGGNYDTRQGVQPRWVVNAVKALGLPVRQ